MQETYQKKSRSAVIIAGFRSPFMFSHQEFKHIREDELGACTIKELIERTSLPKEDIEELIVGSSEGADPYLATSIAQLTGLKLSISACTVKKSDLSSLESLLIASLKIEQGLANIIVAGGVDNISQKPFLFRSHKIRSFFHTKKLRDKLHFVLSLRPSDAECLRGIASLYREQAESNYGKIFADFPISRTQQEQFVSGSFQKALQAQKEGKGKEEIVPIFPPYDFDLKDKDGVFRNPIFKSAHVFDKEPEELVTSCQQALWADGAVFFLIMSQAQAKALGYTPLVSLYSFAYNRGRGQKSTALGPVYSAQFALKKAGLSAQHIDLWEIGESSPAQALACLKGLAELGIADSRLGLGEVDPNKCNVNGGALALGDPPGATSARMVLSLMKEMKRRRVEWGLVTQGLYSQQAGALILKNEA